MKTTNSSPFTASAVEDRRWHSLATRKPARDAFYYAVKTTGIFCRSSCRSRLPNPENVLFFESPAEAFGAGFRPCKRCQPLGPSSDEELAAKIVRACRQIEQSDSVISLSTLAKSVGLSRYYFHHKFKARLGITPREYQAMHRVNRFKNELRRSEHVTAAVYNSGFASASRAYDRVTQKLGMTPRQLQKGGPGEVVFFGLQHSSLGWLLIALSSRGVCAIEIGGNPSEVRQRLKKSLPQAELVEDPVLLAKPIQKLVHYLDHPCSTLGLPLDIRGTAFQQRVWKALQQIPLGETRTYRDIARQIGRPRAVRAVASACAANKLALAVPCHRVVRTDGGLAGYRWGLERKRIVLAKERRKNHHHLATDS